MTRLGDEAKGVDALVADVIEEAKNLRHDVMAYEAAHRRERRAYRFMGAFLIAAIVVCLVLIGAVREGTRSTEEAVELIRSCTTPLGKCYEAAQKNTGDFRLRLQGVIAIITDCDVSTDELVRFRQCVQQRTGIDSSASSEPVPVPPVR